MRRLRASGWNSRLPLVVGEPSPGGAFYDEQSAKTSVWRRAYFRVPEGPWPCQQCQEFLIPGQRARREIRNGEAFYRHTRCADRLTDAAGVHS